VNDPSVPITPEATLRERILATAAAERSPSRATYRRRELLLVVGALAFSIAHFWLRGGVRLGGEVATRPPALVVVTTGGAALVLTMIVGLALVGRRSSLPPAVGLIATVLVAAPLLLLAWKVGASALVGGMSSEWPLRVGNRCFRLGIELGLVPLIALMVARRHAVMRHAALVGAAMGVAAGAWSWTLVDLWCPVAWFPHLLRGHVLPLVLLAALGAVVGAVVLPPARGARASEAPRAGA